MKKYLFIFILLFLLVSCGGHGEYESNYDLENITFYATHYSNIHPIFMSDQGDIFMLDYDSDSSELKDTRAQVLFGNHDSNSENPLKFINIKDDLSLIDGEEIVKVLPYFEGWLFLTNYGNVHKYVFIDQQTMFMDFYIEGSTINLLNLDEDETIIDMNFREDTSMNIIRFEISSNRYIDVFEDQIGIIFDEYELYSNGIFNDSEEPIITLFYFSNDSFYIVTNQDRVIKYNTETKEVIDITEHFPLNQDEKIIGLKYGIDYSTFYLTNQGRLVYIDLDSYSILDTFDLDYDSDDEIIDYKQGGYACNDGLALIETSLGEYYYFDNINHEGQKLNLDQLNLKDGDSVRFVSIEDLFSGGCSSTDQISYNGIELYDFSMIIRVETTDGNVYLLGMLSQYQQNEIGEEYIVLKVI